MDLGPHAAFIVIAYAVAFLDRYPDWQPVAAAVGVIATHLAVTYIVEPTITSRAVGLSPLVILFSLAFWGQCWQVVSPGSCFSATFRRIHPRRS